MRRLLPCLRGARRSLLLGLLAITLSTAFSLTSPWVLKSAIDRLTHQFNRSTLLGYATLLLGIALAEGGLRFVARVRLMGASREIEYRLRNAFFEHLLRLPPEWYHANRTGEVVSRATNDLNAVRTMVGLALIRTVSNSMAFVIGISMMFKIDGRLTLLALAPMLGVTLISRYFGRAIHRRFQRIQAQLADLSAVVQESLAGLRVIRAYRQEEAEIGRFARSNDEYVSRSARLIRLQAALSPSLTLLAGLSASIVLWVGGTEVIAGRLTLGEFVAFNRYLVLLAWPLTAFGWVINLMQRGMASWNRILQVMDAPGRPDESGEPVEIRGEIEFRNLTFSYGGKPVLQDLSLRIAVGQTVGIVGPTGSGKSTLLRLLLRLSEPPAGTVFVDGADIRTIPLRSLRRGFGYVPQEPYLFSDTVRGCIEFGRNGGDARAAAYIACLDDDIGRLPQGQDTVVGERGVTLSGGQKQRVAIARGLYAGAPVLLLDDALSAVDAVTETAILRRSREQRRTRTCLLVSHRLSVVRDADLIVVLDAGRIVERGTHRELVEHGGWYAAMNRRQVLEDELAAS